MQYGMAAWTRDSARCATAVLCGSFSGVLLLLLNPHPFEPAVLLLSEVMSICFRMQFRLKCKQTTVH